MVDLKTLAYKGSWWALVGWYNNTIFYLVLMRQRSSKEFPEPKIIPYMIFHCPRNVGQLPGVNPAEGGRGEKFSGGGSTNPQGHSPSWWWCLVVQPPVARALFLGKSHTLLGYEPPVIASWVPGWKEILHGCLFYGSLLASKRVVGYFTAL